MAILDVIRERRSVRTFDGMPLRPEDARQILGFAAAAGNPFGLPVDWVPLDAKTTGLSSPVIVGADTFLAGKLRQTPFAEAAFGYSMERVVLFAAARGIGTTWIAGTMDRGAFEAAAGLRDGEFMPCITPLGYPAKKMSLRESVMRRGVKADSRLPFSAVFFEESFDRPLTEEAAGRLRDALEAVRLAPSAVNRQPWRVVVCGDKVHFYEKKNKAQSGGWDVQLVDLGIALCHFALTAQEGGLALSFLREDPGIACAADTAYVASYAVCETPDLK